jgi:hypothetical protein
MLKTTNNNISIEIKKHFLSLLEKFSSEKKKSVMVNHFGEFSQDLINSIASSVEEQMIHAGDQKKVVKRVFSILIEGLQNIRLHGERGEDGKQQAYLILVKNPTYYKLGFGNLIQEEDIEQIERYLSKINGMNPMELKELYTSILSNGYISKKGGAGLGFLTMRMKSENPLSHQILRFPNGSAFFSVDAQINRV